MHRNEHSSPNVPNSSLSLSFSAVSPPHLEAPPPFSHSNEPLSSGLRTTVCKSSLLGPAHPRLPSPTLSQRRCGIRSTASLPRDATLHPMGSRWSSPPCGTLPRTQTQHGGVEIVQCPATTIACRCKAQNESQMACRIREFHGTRYEQIDDPGGAPARQE